MRFSLTTSIAILFLLVIVLAILFIGCVRVREGFQTKSETMPVPSNGQIPAGFYQIDDTIMSQLPTGDVVSPLPNLSRGYYIPTGYYSVRIDGLTQWMAKVPDGYMANAAKDGIIPLTTTQTGGLLSATDSPGYAGSGSDVENNPIAGLGTYDPNNYDIQYHDDINDLVAQEGIYDLSFGTMMVVDATGKKIAIPYVPGRALPIYNTPGSFVYGSSTYVPNYADSIYLSRSTGMSTVSAAAVPETSKLGGFCEHLKLNTAELEAQCNRLPRDVCASTDCCVLLGGSRCVSGNEEGPTMKSNYTDPFIQNKDLYYYKGKCYGNCK